jgi:hypothetical protein
VLTKGCLNRTYHAFRRWSSASHHGYPGSISCKCMWVLCWKKWHWNGSVTEYRRYSTKAPCSFLYLSLTSFSLSNSERSYVKINFWNNMVYFNFNHIYIYIYICVCVCVCVHEGNNEHLRSTQQQKQRKYQSATLREQLCMVLKLGHFGN